MGLFQRNPIREEYTMPYTVSYGAVSYMLIVGLGNPGKKYEDTRHNIGFKVIDELAKQLDFEEFKENKYFKAQITIKNLGSNKVILVKPQTYMNESGVSVQAIMKFYKIPIDKLVIIHDELSLKFSQIRTRIGGQAAGHNGIKSVISSVGPEFGRIRVGIKNSLVPKDDTSSFVLAKFNKEEKLHINELVKESALIANEYIYSNQLPHETRSIII